MCQQWNQPGGRGSQQQKLQAAPWHKQCVTGGGECVCVPWITRRISFTPPSKTLPMRTQLDLDPESTTTEVNFWVSPKFGFLTVFSGSGSTRKTSAWWCLWCATLAGWRHVSSCLLAHCDVLSPNDKNVVVPLNINQPNYLSSLPPLSAEAQLVLIFYIVAQSDHSCGARW